ncbi:hypothetical protein [Streptomyces sp. NPDC050264]|uniref:hypothetical protein n=1 Tax=Streptomyces sp. NPDC050264 TaxID=3155038 RepID=UPI00342EB80D
MTSFQLPPYAPELNPVDGLWSLARRAGRNNIAFTDPDHLIGVLRRFSARPSTAATSSTDASPQPDSL